MDRDWRGSVGADGEGRRPVRPRLRGREARRVVQDRGGATPARAKAVTSLLAAGDVRRRNRASRSEEVRLERAVRRDPASPCPLRRAERAEAHHRAQGVRRRPLHRHRREGAARLYGGTGHRAARLRRKSGAQLDAATRRERHPACAAVGALVGNATALRLGRHWSERRPGDVRAGSARATGLWRAVPRRSAIRPSDRASAQLVARRDDSGRARGPVALARASSQSGRGRAVRSRRRRRRAERAHQRR